MGNQPKLNIIFHNPNNGSDTEALITNFIVSVASEKLHSVIINGQASGEYSDDDDEEMEIEM